MSKITKGFKFRIYPHERDIELMNMSFGHTRFIYNHLLGTLITQYDAWKTNPTIYSRPDHSAFALSELITKIKREEDKLWLADVSATILQQAARDLSSAYSNFFRNLKKGAKPGFPRFKKKHARNSFRLTKGNFHIRETKLILSKFNHPVRVAWSRELPSEPSSVTISRDPDGKYYASFICEADPILTNGDKIIGVDRGITDIVVLSDILPSFSKTHKVTNPKYLISRDKSLIRAQKKLSRCTKGSKRYGKARLRVARRHKDISNRRKDFNHKLSRILVNETKILAMETLKPSNLMKNRRLARSIADSGWHQLMSFVLYKAQESQRCSVIEIHPFYPSSKRCNHCGTLNENLKLSDRKWTCSVCDSTVDRDLNASMNIKERGEFCYHQEHRNDEWVPLRILDPGIVALPDPSKRMVIH